MNNLNINEFLRYLANGAVPYLFAGGAYVEVREFYLSNSTALSNWAFLLFLFLLTGTAAYTLYRAVLYPLFYLAAARAAKRPGSLQELDLRRWKCLNKERNTTKYLTEWGSQVHFLYVSSALGLFTLGAGFIFPVTRSEHTVPLLAITVILLLAGFVSHCRLQLREAETIVSDEQL